jgi:hypothetical protein
MKTEGTVEQRMAKLKDIIHDPQMNLLLDPTFLGEGSNPQLPESTIRFSHNIIDCAKLTVFMPAYYAYRRALPYMVSYVRSTGGDVRTSDANIPVGQANSFTHGSANAFFRDIMTGFSTGNYRVELNGKNSHLSDTVPVAISPEHLIPGAVNYLDGHSLILAEVTKYGELRFLNASTTVTRDIYTYNGMNTVYSVAPADHAGEEAYAGCFQGLRVIRYPIAETNGRGKVVKVRRRTNAEMREFGYSTEQFDRLRELVETNRISFGGIEPRSFQDYVRLKMKTVDSIAPLEFMEQYADELLDVYKFREQFVQDAWRNVQQNGPITYPEEQQDENIFQALGRWETWSSPSSDVDRRNKYFYLADWMDFAIRSFGMQPEFIDLSGLEQYRILTQADLAYALVEEKDRIFAEHTMHYTTSRGERVPLTLLDIEERLYNLSFDPNHPPELRWGAPEGSPERESAPKTFTPVPDGSRIAMEEAYRLQSFYRSLGQRETEMSCLRGMFTEGFPVRDKFEGQLSKWFRYNNPTQALAAWAQRNPQTGRRPGFTEARGEGETSTHASYARGGERRRPQALTFD